MAKKRLITFFALAVIFALIFFPGFSKYRKLSSECERLQEKIEELQIVNQRLEEEKHRLENDIEYVEKVAREKMGIVKKDEIPYRIIEEELKDKEERRGRR